MTTVMIDPHLEQTEFGDFLRRHVTGKGYRLEPWGARLVPDQRFTFAETPLDLDRMARRKEGYGAGALYLYDPTGVARRPVLPHTSWVPAAPAEPWAHVYRLVETDGGPDADVPRFPKTLKWQPKTWIKVRDIAQLPVWLQERITIGPPQSLEYLTPAERFGKVPLGEGRFAWKPTGKKWYLTGTEAVERCKLTDSFQVTLNDWPLKYVPRRYLRWLVGDGDLDPLPLPLKGIKSITTVRTMNVLPHTRRDVEGFLERVHDEGVYQTPQVNGWLSGANELWPTFYQEVAFEVDGEAAEQDRSFCTTGWWTGREVPIAEPPLRDGTAATVAIMAGLFPDDPLWQRKWERELRETRRITYVGEVVQGGTSTPVPLAAHGTPLWLDVVHGPGGLPKGGSKRWNRLRSAREGDDDPSPYVLGLHERDTTGRMSLKDYWTPKEDPEGVGGDYVPPLPPRSDAEAWRRGLRLADRLKSLHAQWRQGRTAPAEMTRDAEEEQRQKDREEAVDLIRLVEAELYDQLEGWLEGTRQGHGLFEAVEAGVKETYRTVLSDVYRRTPVGRTERTDWELRRLGRVLWKRLRLKKIIRHLVNPNPTDGVLRQLRPKWLAVQWVVGQLDAAKKRDWAGDVAYEVRHTRRVAQGQSTSREDLEYRRNHWQPARSEDGTVLLGEEVCV